MAHISYSQLILYVLFYLLICHLQMLLFLIVYPFELLDLNLVHFFEKSFDIVLSQVIHCVVPVVPLRFPSRSLSWIVASEIAQEDIESRIMRLESYGINWAMHNPGNAVVKHAMLEVDHVI